MRSFQHRESIDYAETFASVVKPMSYKAIFAVAAAKKLRSLSDKYENSLFLRTD